MKALAQTSCAQTAAPKRRRPNGGDQTAATKRRQPNVLLRRLTLFANAKIHIYAKHCISGKSKDKADLTKENLQSLSPDYDSISEAELNESMPRHTTPETAAPTEDISDTYSALTERHVINQLAVVYSSIEATPFNVEVLPKMASKMSPLYVNIANY